ncbi:hypothetical protein B0H65DRAFT_561432 [Neurospora tetraspora]|uniref:Uncharacterized protein n=1 Tax=Neurospora tetraspora TaxID=94610 RepID=A0AAE0J1J7_9PEZI|nr:hypothetical protein B0H65DRAFT_561432 [Neurospora tetraspora]
MDMEGVFNKGLDNSAKNAAAVFRTVFIAFAIECTVPLTLTQLRIELRKPPIPPIIPNVEERKKRVFADVDEFIVIIYKRLLYKKIKAKRECV